MVAPRAQRLMRMMAGMAHSGSWSQAILGRPMESRRALRRPNSVLRMKLHRTALATAGTMLGQVVDGAEDGDAASLKVHKEGEKEAQNQTDGHGDEGEVGGYFEGLVEEVIGEHFFEVAEADEEGGPDHVPVEHGEPGCDESGADEEEEEPENEGGDEKVGR